ncbi:MAG TPA: phosphatase PAP2 family protein [Longimicrobium sp.]|jgi:undecaprenyl-diphosphatase|uniref:phosphatase PAP2 family protein n=1 Tax=Longimicrobium sp. TaxID=2029185 RepID=UPI002EDB6B24
MSTRTESTLVERRTEPRRGPGARARDGLFALLRWIGRHVQGFRAALGVFLALGLTVVLVGSIAFATLANRVMAGRTQQVDEAILRWMGEHGSESLNVAALEVTALGARLVVWMVVLVASAFLWVSRHRWSAALLWVSMLGSGLVNMALKSAFNRPRPDVFPWRTPHAGTASFPSGHAMTSMVVYGTLGFLIGRLMPTRTLKWCTWAVAALVIGLVSASRLYLGVHYPSDVLGGLMTGAAWAVTCGLGMEAVRYFRHRRPQVAAEERDLTTPPAES